jgi:hypothetical protein
VAPNRIALAHEVYMRHSKEPAALESACCWGVWELSQHALRKDAGYKQTSHTCYFIFHLIFCLKQRFQRAVCRTPLRRSPATQRFIWRGGPNTSWKGFSPPRPSQHKSKHTIQIPVARNCGHISQHGRQQRRGTSHVAAQGQIQIPLPNTGN